MGAATLGLALASALAACGGGSEESGGGGGGGGSTTLTAAWTVAPAQIDPVVFTGLTSVYATDPFMATLLEYDQSVGGEGGRVVGPQDIIPSIAESWEANEDGTQYTLKLRKGVKSPAGNELTADDVVWTFERFYSEPASLQAGVLLPTANVDPEKPMVKVDDYTVEYNLTEPSAVSLSILAYPILGILDSTEVKKHTTKDDPWGKEWLASNSAGFGPYQLDSITPSEQLTFSLNENYFGDKPDFEKIIIRGVPEGASRAQLLMSGDVDMITEPPIDQIAAINRADGVSVTEQPAFDRHNLSVNHDDPILGKAEVRRAISTAINREALVESVYQGYASPAVTPIASGLYDQEPFIEYDPDQAKQMLADAGYPNGFDMELAISNERPGPYAETIARLIQADLKAIGVNVTINAVPSAADFEAAVSERKYQSYLYTERPSQPDPAFDFFLYIGTGSALNTGGYSNPEFDELTDQALSMDPGPERDAVIDQGMEILSEEEPIISTVELPALVGLNDRVTGFVALPSNHTEFGTLKMAD